MEEIRIILVVATIVAVPPMVYVYVLGIRAIVRKVRGWIRSRDVVGRRLEMVTSGGEEIKV